MTLSFLPKALGLIRQGLLLGLACLTFACAPGAQAAPDVQMRYQDFTGPHLGENSGYGTVMAASGDWLAVGAPQDAAELTGTYIGGKVLLWKRDGSTGAWTLRQRLISPASGTGAGNRFGSTLAIQGSRLLIGSSPTVATHHVFQLVDDVWTLDGTLPEPAGSPKVSSHRRTLAISGDIVAIGSPDGYISPSTTPVGWVDIFIRQSPGTWVHQTRLRDSNAGNNMGSAVAFLADGSGGSRLLIGCPEATVAIAPGSGRLEAGKIMIYDRSPETGAWTAAQDITATAPASFERFGSIFQIWEDRLYVLSRVTSATPWLTELSISGGYSQVNRFSISGLGSLGTFMATDGSRLVLGSRNIGLSANLYIYHRSTSDNQAWIQQTHQVSVAGFSSQDAHYSALWTGENQLLLSSYLNNSTAREWTVRTATRDTGAWAFRSHLQPLDTRRMRQGAFGSSISRQGDWLAIGAPGSQDTRGYVYTYRQQPDGSLRFHSALPEPAAGTMPLTAFGTQVSCHSGRILVGASIGYDFVGAAFLYTWDAATDRWVQDTTFGHAEMSGGTSYGRGLALTADLAAISDPGENRAYIYRRTGTTWSQEAELTSPADPDSESFGNSLSLDGTRLLVGAPQAGKGSAYLFERKSTDLSTASTWTRISRLAPPTGLGAGSFFGHTVSLSGDRALVSGGLSTVPACMYRRSGTTWRFHMKLPTTGQTDVLTGLLSGSVAIVNSKTSITLFALSKDQWVRISPDLNEGVHTIGGLAYLGQDLYFAGVTGPTGGITGTVTGRNLSLPPRITWSGDVSGSPITPTETELYADSYLVGTKNDRMVRFRLQGQGTLPVRVNATLDADTAEASLTATSWDIGIAGEAECYLRFKAMTEGEKLLTVDFTIPGSDTPLATYTVHVHALTTPDRPDFSVQPPSALIKGSLAGHILSAEIYGTRPWTYRWLKNGKYISGQTGPTLQVTTPGSYQIEVSGPGGKVRSQAAAIGQWDNPAPVVYALAGQTARLPITAAGPGMQITWTHAADSQPVEEGSVYTGTQTPTLTIQNAQPEHSQEYIALIHMTAEDGTEFDTEANVTFAVVSPPHLSIFGPDDGRLYIGQTPPIEFYVEFENWDGSLPVYTISGLPPGVTAAPDGQLTGTPNRPGTYTVRASARIAGFTTNTFTSTFIVTEPDLPTPGLYWGNVYFESDFPLGGAASVDLRADGSFTGSLMAAGAKKYPLSGRLTTENSFSSIPVKIAYPFTFGPQLASISGDAEGLSLLIQSPGAPDTQQQLAVLYLIRSTTAAPLGADLIGKHSFGLLSHGTSADTPGGNSFGTLTLTADGRGTYSGELADGSRITGSGWLSEPVSVEDPIRRFHFYWSDSSGRQSLTGATQIDHPNPLGLGGVFWTRLPRPGRVYPEGVFAALDWYGSRYQAATAATVFAGGSAPSMYLNFAQGYLPPTFFLLSPQLKATFGAGALNPASIKLSITASTGIFTGQFTLQDPDPADDTRTLTRTIQYRGILLPGHRIGAGYFLYPDLPDPYAEPPTTLKTSLIHSGDLRIRLPE